jgi:hypothetical protein
MLYQLSYASPKTIPERLWNRFATRNSSPETVDLRRHTAAPRTSRHSLKG